MRNLLALVGFIVVMFAGLGWYFNWYSFNIKASTDGKGHAFTKQARRS